MCAIHGFCWQDDGGQMARMLRAAKHRGPDGKGSWSALPITLGHNLLAVTDAADNSRQPWSHGSRYSLVFNGEAYNHLELREQLDHLFRTYSDTETLAAGLAQRGPEFLHWVDGMFALAWYDSEANTVTLARDSNGARPLYYGFLGGKLAFSSEIKSLLELGFDRVVCREAFRHFYHAGLVAGPLTMFQGIYKLVPGEVITFTLPGTVKSRFNLNSAVAPYEGDPGDLPRKIADRLNRAVTMTMSGRRKVGVLLSGGIDSSAVLYEAARPLTTFTTRFDAPGVNTLYNSDADSARRTSKLLGSTHHEVLVTEQLWVENFQRAVMAMEEPRQGRSHAAYYMTNKVASDNGVVVTLSGDGGDELLAGYKYYRGFSFRDRFEALRRGHRGLVDPDTRLSVDDQIDYLTGWLPSAGLTGDALNDFMYTDCLHTLAEDFLARSDKLGAAFGMEARFPFMCSVFRDFARSIPGNLKMVGDDAVGGWDTNNKPLMRMAYSDRMPSYITRKSKTGWRAPTDEWVIGRPSAPAPDDSPIRNLFRSLLSDPDVRAVFELTDDVIENRFLNNRDMTGPNKPSGKPSDGIGRRSQKELFTVAVFAQWFKSFKMRMW